MVQVADQFDAVELYNRVKVRGRAKAEAVFTFAAAAYNLLRIPKLLAGAAR